MLHRYPHISSTSVNKTAYIKKDIIIFYDRGLMDGKAYMNPNEFNKILIQEGYTEENIKSGYDAVFHLVSAADGVENFYTVENNKAESERALLNTGLSNLKNALLNDWECIFLH